MVLNVVAGVVGALSAGRWISPVVEIGTTNQERFSLAGLAVSFVGAALLLSFVKLFDRGTVR